MFNKENADNILLSLFKEVKKIEVNIQECALEKNEESKSDLDKKYTNIIRKAISHKKAHEIAVIYLVWICGAVYNSWKKVRKCEYISSYLNEDGKHSGLISELNYKNKDSIRRIEKIYNRFPTCEEFDNNLAKNKNLMQAKFFSPILDLFSIEYPSVASQYYNGQPKQEQNNFKEQSVFFKPQYPSLPSFLTLMYYIGENALDEKNLHLPPIKNLSKRPFSDDSEIESKI